jgi:hypothetical protein
MHATVEASTIEAMERERVQALVNGNLAIARQFHADEYELITPLGATLSREQYLGALAAGNLRSLAWDIESPMKVRVYSETALVRYRVVLEVVVDARAIPHAPYWHTDIYENRDGRWQVVWSQATRIEPGLP